MKWIKCPSCPRETFYHIKGKCHFCYARERRESPEGKEKLRLWREKNRAKENAKARERRRIERSTSLKVSSPPPSSNPFLGFPKGLSAKQLRNRRQNLIKRLDGKIAKETETFVCEACGKIGKTDPAHIISRRFQKTRHLKENIRRRCRECHENEPRDVPHKKPPRRTEVVEYLSEGRMLP